MKPFPSQAVLYLQDTFDKANLSKAQLREELAEALEIGSSGFSCVILGQWHVQSDGSLWYNDTPLNDVQATLPMVVQALKQTGGVQKVLISFGPFAADFDHIAADLQGFRDTVASLCQGAGIDGLDWDLEGGYTDQQANALMRLTIWANQAGLLVTAAPYQMEEFWTNLLKAVGPDALAWWNLQIYGGADYDTWVAAVQDLVPDPYGFIVPGYSVTDSTPAEVQAQLTALKTTDPRLIGGFIWQYEHIVSEGYQPPQYAAAIVQAVTGV